jgi:hypothetical protein
MTTKRTAFIMKQVGLAAERLRDREVRERAEIVNQNAARGMLESGQTIYRRHDVLVRTLVDLLRLRMDVEVSTPLRPKTKSRGTRISPATSGTSPTPRFRAYCRH